jgi:hypothetical protein
MRAFRRHRRDRRRKTDALGRDISKPHWYRRLPTGQQCDCDVEDFEVEKSKQKHGHSDSLVRYMRLCCPECDSTFGWADYVVEG